MTTISDEVRYVIQQRRKPLEGKNPEPWYVSNFNQLNYWTYYLPSVDESGDGGPLAAGQKERVDELRDQMPHLEFQVVQERRKFEKRVVYG